MLRPAGPQTSVEKACAPRATTSPLQSKKQPRRSATWANPQLLLFPESQRTENPGLIKWQYFCLHLLHTTLCRNLHRFKQTYSCTNLISSYCRIWSQHSNVVFWVFFINNIYYVYEMCIYSMSALRQTGLHTEMQIKWFVGIKVPDFVSKQLGDLISYTRADETRHCLRMRLQIPLQSRLQNAVLYNQRTSTRLTGFAVHSCFLCTYMFDCKFGAIRPLATRPHAADLSRFVSTRRTPTAVFFGLPPGPPPADLTSYYNR